MKDCVNYIQDKCLAEADVIKRCKGKKDCKDYLSIKSLGKKK